MGRLFCVVAALLSATAVADPYDFQIFKLGNPSSSGVGFTDRANGNFRVFARQLAAAISSVNLSPPETLGHAGFAFSADLSVVSIAQDANGNDGIIWPTRSALGSPLLIPSVHVRKGLPFSFELGGRIGWLEQSRMAVGTIELKWAINEGFTYLPDIGITGRLTKLVNSRDFDLTVGGVDIGVGKQFALGGMVTVTPYVGWNLQFVGASTGPVDFNPQRSAAESEQPDQKFKDIYVYDGLDARLERAQPLLRRPAFHRRRAAAGRRSVVLVDRQVHRQGHRYRSLGARRAGGELQRGPRFLSQRRSQRAGSIGDHRIDAHRFERPPPGSRHRPSTPRLSGRAGARPRRARGCSRLPPGASNRGR